MADQEFAAGKRVQFQLKDDSSLTVFYGTVTRIHNGAPLIQPEKQLSPRSQLINIKAVENPVTTKPLNLFGRVQ